MNNRLPWDITAADADDGKVAAAAEAQVVRRLMVMLLLTATALDLTRCGLVMTAPRHSAPAAGLVAAGLAAAALTARTARGCRACQRWAGWAALLIGAASAPQAAASGFRSPYTIPDTATAALGMLLAITILATAGRMHRRDTTPKIPACWTREPGGDPARGRTFPSPRSPGRYLFTSVEPMCETNTADAQPLHPPGEESVRSMNTGYVLNVLVDGPADTAWSRSHTQPALRRQRTMIDLSAASNWPPHCGLSAPSPHVGISRRTLRKAHIRGSGGCLPSIRRSQSAVPGPARSGRPHLRSFRPRGG